MSKQEINIKSAERINIVLKEFGWSQVQLANEIGYSVQQINRLCRGKCRLEEPVARQIATLFPSIRFQWLLALDDEKTHEERLTRRDNKMKDYVSARLAGVEIINEIKKELELGQINPDGLLHILDYTKLVIASGLYHITPNAKEEQ